MTNWCHKFMVIVGWKQLFDQFLVASLWIFVPWIFDDSTEMVRIWFIDRLNSDETASRLMTITNEQNRSVTVDWTALHCLTIIDLTQRVDSNANSSDLNTLIFRLITIIFYCFWSYFLRLQRSGTQFKFDQFFDLTQLKLFISII